MQITRTGLHYPNPAFSKWRSDMARQITAQLATITALTVPVKAGIEYWPGDLRRRDVPAILDALWHLLEFCRILKDDALIQAVDYKQMPLDRTNPRCSILLSPIVVEVDASRETSSDADDNSRWTARKVWP